VLTIAVIIDRDYGLDCDQLLGGSLNEFELIIASLNACGDPAWLVAHFDQQRLEVPVLRSCPVNFSLYKRTAGTSDIKPLS
jgi:hypothetical protein